MRFDYYDVAAEKSLAETPKKESLVLKEIFRN